MPNKHLALTPGNWDDLNDFLGVSINKDGTLKAAPARYVVASDGTTVTGYDQNGAAVVSNTDGGAVLTALLPAASSAGAMIEFRNDGNVFPWGSTPKVPQGITNRLLIRLNGATYQLSAGAPRFLDPPLIQTNPTGGGFTDDATINVTSTAAFASSGTLTINVTGGGPVTYTGKTATSFTGCTCPTHVAFSAGNGVTQAHLTCQNVTIEGGGAVVDNNNVGGKHHILFGTYINGATSDRVNFDNIRIENIRIINVPVDPTTTNHRLGVWIIPQQRTANEAIQNTVTNITVENVRQLGGNAGIMVGGTGGSSGGPDCNVMFDNVLLRKCYHSMLGNTVQGFGSSNFQIGSRGKGGPIGCRIEDCYGDSSGDVGIEVDNCCVDVVGCTIVDCHNASFFHTNFNTPVNEVRSQTVRFTECAAVHLTPPLVKSFSFRTASQTTPVPLGTIIMDRCRAYLNNGGEGATGWAIWRSDNQAPATPFTTKLIVNEFELEHVIAGTAAPTVTAIDTSGCTTGTNIVEIDGVRATFSGDHVSGGALVYYILYLAGSTMRFNVRRVFADVSTTNVTSNAFRLVTIGNVTTVLSGLNTIRGLGFNSVSGGGTAPIMLQVKATGTLTINGKIIVENADASQLTSGFDLLTDATQVSKVHYRSNIYKNSVAPVPAGLTGLVTATGVALGKGWDAHVVFTQGSGAGITAIDYSTNGGTTYTNFLTQAAGALPAGFDQVLGPLPTDALIKVTFTTTQPTITLVPVNP